MAETGWSEMSRRESMAKRQLKLAFESLKRLEEGNLPENEKRIAVATFLECLLSSLVVTLMNGDAEEVVQSILGVYDRIWHS